MKVVTWQSIAETFTIIDGELWRLPKRYKLKRVSTTANTANGYVQVRMNGSLWAYHRLIYMLHHKTTLTADQVVDHIIEGNKTNNAISNLQVLTQSDNVKKAKTYKLPKLHRGKYYLAIKVNDNKVHLGGFVEESDYWVAHAKTLRLFGTGTKGLAFARNLNKVDAKEFIKSTFQEG